MKRHPVERIVSLPREGCYAADGTPIKCHECGHAEFNEKMHDFIDFGVGAGPATEIEYFCGACGESVAYWAYGIFDPAYLDHKQANTNQIPNKPHNTPTPTGNTGVMRHDEAVTGVTMDNDKAVGSVARFAPVTKYRMGSVFAGMDKMEKDAGGDYVRYADHAREIESLQRELDNERVRGVHSCSIYCDRPLCVARREIESLRQRVEAAAAQAERRHQECGVDARIMYEDPRYQTLVLEGDEFGTIGYELRRDTGELRRVCICHAHCEHECVCGYDAAISAEMADTRSGRDG